VQGSVELVAAASDTPAIPVSGIHSSSSQVFQVHNIEQFLFLIADDDGSAMSCPRLDHFGLSVGAESELDDILDRAKKWQSRDDRVDIIDKKTEDHGMLAITSIYLKYLLPMMLEIQWWDYKGDDSAAWSRPVNKAAK